MFSLFFFLRNKLGIHYKGKVIHPKSDRLKTKQNKRVNKRKEQNTHDKHLHTQECHIWA